MTDIDEAKIKKHPSLYLPSFKINMGSTEASGTEAWMSTEGLGMGGGTTACSIDVRAGMPPEAALKVEFVQAGWSCVINEPFIFALNDQQLEMNNIENTVMIAAKVDKKDWTKV